MDDDNKKKTESKNKVLSSIDKAHNILYQAENIEGENALNDIGNGLLLNKCFHTMYDKYLFSINPQNNILVFSQNITDSEYYHNYIKYNNTYINIPYECNQYLLSHYKKFLSINSY